jgi:hypothetical protein
MSNFSVSAIESLRGVVVMPLCAVTTNAVGFVDIRVPVFWSSDNPLVTCYSRVYILSDGSSWCEDTDLGLCLRCSMMD